MFFVSYGLWVFFLNINGDRGFNILPISAYRAGFYLILCS